MLNLNKIVRIFLIFTLLISFGMYTVLGDLENVNKTIVEVNQQIIYNINMNGTVNVTVHQTIWSNESIILEAFIINFAVKNYGNERVNHVHIHMDVDEIDIIHDKNNSRKLKSGTFFNVYEFKKSINIEKGYIPKNDMCCIDYSYDIKNAIFNQSVTQLSYHTVTFEFNKKPNEYNLSTKKSIYVILPNDEYNYSRYKFSTIPPKYVYTQDKVTTIVYEFGPENSDFDYNHAFSIHFTTHESTLEKTLDNATTNSLELGRISLNLGKHSLMIGFLGFFIGVISIILNMGQINQEFIGFPKSEFPKYNNLFKGILFSLFGLFLIVISKTLSTMIFYLKTFNDICYLSGIICLIGGIIYFFYSRNKKS